MMSKTTAILLAGGKGQRIQSTCPKQFLFLGQKRIFEYSLEVLDSIEQISEIIIVCSPKYRALVKKEQLSTAVRFAMPGRRRQDSVSNALDLIEGEQGYVCIHDSARPFISYEFVQKLLRSSYRYGAAIPGTPVKFTLKQVSNKGFVEKTLDRARCWEVQTPQITKVSWLKQAFTYAKEHNLAVTDDVSLIEHLDRPIKVVEGSYSNIKITTPEDLSLAETLLADIQAPEPALSLS